MKLRKHQSEMEKVIDRKIAGAPIENIYLYACPGAGKSSIPISVCRLIDAGIVDKIAWIVPRNSLKDQAERNFLDPFFRDLYQHNFVIRSSTNEINPSRSTNGFVTTFQAAGIDEQQTIRREFCNHRYALVLDEFHHLQKDGEWHNAIAPLVDLAKVVIYMSGTPERGDRKPIAFAKYRKTGMGLTIDMAEDKNTAVIRYSRRDALAENAILPLNFRCHDGAVEWMTDSGRKVQYGSLQHVPRLDASAAIYTALATEFSEQLLKEGLYHWQNYRRTVNTRSKLMVVTADYNHAKATLNVLRRLGIRSDIATSHETTAAKEAIKRFKYGNLNVLVSIAMAYEGFSCKPLSHLIALTRIRSRSWIEQMIARTVRNDPDSNGRKQAGYIFCPDDPLFRDVIEKVKADQATVLKDKGEKAPDDRQGQLQLFDGGEPMAPGNIIPLGSHLSGARDLALGHVPASAPIPLTEYEREYKLRKEIDAHVKAYCRACGCEPRKINSELKTYFEKPRELMTRPELELVKIHLLKFYKLTSRQKHYRKAPKGWGLPMTI